MRPFLKHFKAQHVAAAFLGAILSLLVSLSANAQEFSAQQQPDDAVANDHTPLLYLSQIYGRQTIFSPDAFKTLLGIVEKDPQDLALLNQAKDMTGVSGFMDLYRFFRIDENAAKDEGGSTWVEAHHSELLIPNENIKDASSGGSIPPDVMQNFRDQITQNYNATHLTVKVTPDYLKAQWRGDAHICMVNRANLGTAVDTFVHELRHFVDFDPGREANLDLLSFKNSEEFAETAIIFKGEEVDAFISQYGSRIRLDHAKTNVPDFLIPFFDDQGSFVGDRAALGRVMLKKVPYFPQYQDFYLKLLIAERDSIVVPSSQGHTNRRDILNTDIDYRKQYLLQPGLDDETKAATQASITRLQGELLDLDRRLPLLNQAIQRETALNKQLSQAPTNSQIGLQHSVDIAGPHDDGSDDDSSTD